MTVQDKTLHDYYLSEKNRVKNLENLGKEIDSIFKKNEKTIVSQEHFYPPEGDIKTFPDSTWLLHIKFKLKKPFHSRDERISESNNPILRDKLFGCPMVTPSTWKGNLRFAARKINGENKERIGRLFGPESDSDEDARKGRLYFYPTFFTGKTEKSVITPLSRETRTPVRGPIDMEVVPTGETGDFYLLYFPYPKGKEWSQEEALEDLKLTVEALEKMFLEYGFSAKKTSGSGVILEEFGDSSLVWDEKNEGRNRGYDKIKNFQTLKEEANNMGGGKE